MTVARGKSSDSGKILSGWAKIYRAQNAYSRHSTFGILLYFFFSLLILVSSSSVPHWWCFFVVIVVADLAPISFIRSHRVNSVCLLPSHCCLWRSAMRHRKSRKNKMKIIDVWVKPDLKYFFLYCFCWAHNETKRFGRDVNEREWNGRQHCSKLMGKYKWKFERKSFVCNWIYSLGLCFGIFSYSLFFAFRVESSPVSGVFPSWFLGILTFISSRLLWMHLVGCLFLHRQVSAVCD